MSEETVATQEQPVEQAPVEEQQNAAIDVLDTPELKVAPQEADAHRATITGVTAETFDSGTRAMKIGLYSQDSGFDTNLTIFPPAEWVADPTINPNDLPSVPAEGKKQSAQERYAQVVSNTNKTAELQKLRQMATAAGRNADPVTTEGIIGKPRPETFDELVAVYHYLLSGLDVVFTRRPDKSDDPRFNGRLKTSAIMPFEEAMKPKALKNYKKLWEQA